VQKEAPIHVSNVMLLDPRGNKPTRVGMKIVKDETTGRTRRLRVAKATGETV
jgi:large subunit ribosomal protein L24